MTPIGVIMSIKVETSPSFKCFLLKLKINVIGIGEGLFGYRRNQDGNGKLTGQDKT